MTEVSSENKENDQVGVQKVAKKKSNKNEKITKKPVDKPRSNRAEKLRMEKLEEKKKLNDVSR